MFQKSFQKYFAQYTCTLHKTLSQVVTNPTDPKTSALLIFFDYVLLTNCLNIIAAMGFPRNCDLAIRKVQIRSSNWLIVMKNGNYWKKYLPHIWNRFSPLGTDLLRLDTRNRAHWICLDETNPTGPCPFRNSYRKCLNGECGECGGSFHPTLAYNYTI